jgi:predicted  nucleic acid-binding Zn-ribbon protein
MEDISNVDGPIEPSKKAIELARVLESLGLIESSGYKNLIAIKIYTESTREMFRKMQSENKILLDQFKQQNLALEGMRQQISQLQIRMMSINNTTG